MNAKRYVIVGTGSRGYHSYLMPLLNDFRGQAEVVGLYDANIERARAVTRLAKSDVPVFASFNGMLAKAKPNAVIVTSTDATHAQYVVKALKAGLDVFSEKPLCTVFKQVKAIRAAAAASSGVGRVTHNMRFLPNSRRIKQEIVDGTIGKILQVRFVETLDRFHGADYFRRWHRRMANSGGLVLQKSSHHFDFVNWLVGSKPAVASAHGRLAYYGKSGPFRGERCSTCAHAAECPLYADVFANQWLKTLYRDVEHVDGYLRDACVFGEEIDIPDTIHAAVTYENGVELSYSINGYGAFEGMHIAVEGTLGCIELVTRHDTSWAVGHKQHASKGTLAADGTGPDTRNIVMLYPAPQTGQPRRELTPAPETGGHGGADPMLRRMMFGLEPVPDPLGLKASLEEGIQAVLIGMAINESMRRGSRPIAVQTMKPAAKRG